MFKAKQIEALRKEWSKVTGPIDPKSPGIEKLRKFLNSLDQPTLIALAGAGIRFVSPLANLRVKRPEYYTI